MHCSAPFRFECEPYSPSVFKAIRLIFDVLSKVNIWCGQMPISWWWWYNYYEHQWKGNQHECVFNFSFSREVYSQFSKPFVAILSTNTSSCSSIFSVNTAFFDIQFHRSHIHFLSLNTVPMSTNMILRNEFKEILGFCWFSPILYVDLLLRICIDFRINAMDCVSNSSTIGSLMQTALSLSGRRCPLFLPFFYGLHLEHINFYSNRIQW